MTDLINYDIKQVPQQVLVENQLSMIEDYINDCIRTCNKKDIVKFETLFAMCEQLVTFIEPEEYEIIIH